MSPALARHSVEIGLPMHYVLNHAVPEGKMRVVGIKANKISSTKAVLIVKFISPPRPSLTNVQMQMFRTSLEPNTKQGQGADLSIMTALTLTNPGTKSLFDLGVRCEPRSEITRGMIAAFDSMLDGTIWLHRKRHLMTLRHQSRILSVMSATCDHPRIQSAIPKAHPTPNTTTRRCEAP